MKKRRLVRLSLAVLLSLIGSGIGQYHENQADAIIVPPDYAGFSPPEAVGADYIDPAFGTLVRRVSNCTGAGEDALGGYFSNSEICCFNHDGSLFIAAEDVVTNGKRLVVSFLYDGRTGGKLQTLQGSNFQPWWIRWALAGRCRVEGQILDFDPTFCFFKYEGNEIRLYDVREFPGYILVRRFDEYSSIGPAGGEGDLSDDGRYWCLDGDGRELFVYDLIDDIKYPASSFDLGTLGSPGSKTGVDYAAVSADGQWVVVSWSTEPSTDRYHGIELYDREWNFQRQLYPGIIHWEVGVDAFGHQVLYTAASFSLPEFFTRYGVNPGDIISIRLKDGYIRLLKEMKPWAPQVMSACNSVTDPTRLYVSFYARSQDPQQLWAPLWGEIVGIATDGSQTVDRLVHHRSRPVPGKSEKYWQPDFVVNRQASTVLFRSTFTGAIGDMYLFSIFGDTAEPDVEPPLAPQQFYSPEQGKDEIELRWSPPAPAPDGDVAESYRLYRDGDDIAHVYSTSFVDVGLVEAQLYRYALYSVDDAGLTSLEPARLEVSTRGDSVPPFVIDCSLIDPNRLRLLFSEAMDSLSLAKKNAYRFEPELELFAVEVATGCRQVELWFDPLEPGVEYRLWITGLVDQSQQRNGLFPNEAIPLRVAIDFSDSFSESDLSNWRFRNPERWRVDSNGVLWLQDSGYESPGGYRLGEYALLDANATFPLRLHFGCLARSAESLEFNPYADYALIFNFRDSLNYDYVQLHAYDVAVAAIIDGERQRLNKVAHDLSLDEWNQIELVLEPELVRVEINRESVLDLPWVLGRSGRLGLGSFNDSAWFDGVTVQALASADSEPPAAPTGLKIENLP
ncbi:fibronectin type III domain-containing protein [candidate division KSB1 bacterium]|nr:fibronectin type III domain-containing protein [candidate division KSB1 bacterium]